MTAFPPNWLRTNNKHDAIPRLADAELERFNARRAVVGDDLLHSPVWIILAAMFARPRAHGAHPFAELSRVCRLSEDQLSRWLVLMETRRLVEIGASAFGQHATLTQFAEDSLIGYFAREAKAEGLVAKPNLLQRYEISATDIAVGATLALFMAQIFVAPLASMAGM